MLPVQGKVKPKSLSCGQLFATPWTVACPTPLSMGFFRQEYCSGLPFPSPGDLPKPGIEPRSPALQADSLPSEPSGKGGPGSQSGQGARSHMPLPRVCMLQLKVSRAAKMENSKCHN